MNYLTKNQYKPDYVSPPGETILELLENRSMSRLDLAEQMSQPLERINEMIDGNAAITSGMALQLEQVFDVSANFWNNREKHCREAIERSLVEDMLILSQSALNEIWLAPGEDEAWEYLGDRFA